MIEFKGAYSNRTTKKPKTVLVQYDGVRLHVWQMSDPFCRLVTSDVFSLMPSVGIRKGYIKLPNGDKIETDDINAFKDLTSYYRSHLTSFYQRLIASRKLFWISLGLALVVGGYILLAMLVFP